MIDILTNVVLIALGCAFIISLADKWRIVEWLQLHGSELVSKAANCRFCLSWWVNLIVCSAVAFGTKDYTFLFVPFFSTILTRFFL